jgi:hypothetical protein
MSFKKEDTFRWQMSASQLPPVLETKNYIPFTETNGEQQTYTHR